MRAPPLCIIQARLNSHRLPNKMLMTLRGETLIARAYRLASTAFYEGNVVVAIPEHDEHGPLGDELRRMDVRYHAPKCGESDLLSRFHAVAHIYRWHPDCTIVRWTPDDPFKKPDLCRRVAAGERLPVELGAEAFTLSMLDEAERKTFDSKFREHITHALFPNSPPMAAPPSDHGWTIDTLEDLNRIATSKYLAAEARNEAW